MIASFRRSFFPTDEEKIERFEMLISLHEDQLNYCSTCIHYISSMMPGFVTDYGRCAKNSPIFEDKVCGNTQENCPYYAEDTQSVQRLRKMIAKLKEERNETR